MEKTAISMHVLTVFFILALNAAFNSVEGAVPALPRRRECGPVCEIFCPNGNVLDRWGCPTCTCRGPILGPECSQGYSVMRPRRSCRMNVGSHMQCGRGARCQSMFGGTEGVCCRRRLSVPGRCPRVMTQLICPAGPAVIRPEDCQTDQDCPRRQRCCQFGCGRRCMAVIIGYGRSRD